MALHAPRSSRAPAFAAATVILLAAACATLQQVAALRRVDFEIDRVADARLAGIELAGRRSYQDLTAAQVATLGLALSRRQLPFEFRLHLTASNPEDNPVAARLLQMEWSLFLEDRETVSGALDRSYQLEPGQPEDIPLTIRLDLLEFFERSGPDLVELALAVAGQGGAPRRISLRALPTVDTPLGPIRYPEPITIVSREVGAEGR